MQVSNKLPPGQNASEAEVAWEDQNRINTFSKLNSRLSVLEDKLKNLKQEKEYLDDVGLEIELIDEDDKISYKIGESFISLKQSEVAERLEKDAEKMDGEINKLETKIEGITDEMGDLKTLLYAKFGHSINLER